MKTLFLILFVYTLQTTALVDENDALQKPIVLRAYPKKAASFISKKPKLLHRKYNKKTYSSKLVKEKDIHLKDYTVFPPQDNKKLIDIPNSPYFPLDINDEPKARVKKVLPDYNGAVQRRKRDADAAAPAAAAAPASDAAPVAVAVPNAAPAAAPTAAAEIPAAAPPAVAPAADATPLKAPAKEVAPPADTAVSVADPAGSPAPAASLTSDNKEIKKAKKRTKAGNSTGTRSGKKNKKRSGKKSSKKSRSKKGKKSSRKAKKDKKKDKSGKKSEKKSEKKVSDDKKTDDKKTDDKESSETKAAAAEAAPAAQSRRNNKRRSGVARRLIAARDGMIETYPYVVSIQKDNEHWCAGAILNPRLVITTANCLWKSNRVSRMRVRACSRHSDRGGQVLRIQEVMKHPGWSIRKNPDCDLALFLVDKNIKFSDSCHALDLPNRVMMPAFDDAWVTSWGSERRDGIFERRAMALQVYHARLIDRGKCHNITQRFGVGVTENFICLAQTGRRAPCTRDTGAPAVSDGVLWGLASWGIRKMCGTERFPAMFSYIASHSNMDFIINATTALMSDERQYPFLDRYPPGEMQGNDFKK